jgi:hypothetical protein
MGKIMTMDKDCEYFKLEEKKYQGNSIDRNCGQRFSQNFVSGKCSHEKCSEQFVSYYGLVEFCQISDVDGND